MTNYQKGARFERKLVNQARSQGKIAFRSAGSHSPIDLCIIDESIYKIQFIQCKTGKLSNKKKDSIIALCKRLTGHYSVDFRLEHKP